MYKYFCDSCEHKFTSEVSDKGYYFFRAGGDSHGGREATTEDFAFLSLTCPECGGADIRPDSDTGREDSVQAALEYDNDTNF